MFKIEYDKSTHRKVHDIEDIEQAIKIIEEAINFTGLENFKSRVDGSIMEMALEEMYDIDGYDEAFDNDDLDDFQLEASYDKRGNGSTAAGEEVCGILNIEDWSMVCYTGAIVWQWRYQTNFFDNYFGYDGIEFEVIEIEGDE